MPKGEGAKADHGFGSAYRRSHDNRDLKCHCCGESKSNSCLNADGYRYVCDSCQGGSNE